jgi:hypothetical protein
MSEYQMDMGAQNAQLIVALANARAAIDNLLVAIAQDSENEAHSREVVQEEALAMPADCQHKNRQDLGGFGVKEHWICKDCGHEFIRR